MTNDKSGMNKKEEYMQALRCACVIAVSLLPMTATAAPSVGDAELHPAAKSLRHYQQNPQYRHVISYLCTAGRVAPSSRQECAKVLMADLAKVEGLMRRIQTYGGCSIPVC